MENTWQEALLLIKNEVRDHYFDKWFSNRAINSVEKRGNVVYIFVMDQPTKISLTTLYFALIKSTLETLLDEDIQLEIVNIEQERAPEPEEVRGRSVDRFASSPVFNERYTFDSFVVGNSNRFAHAAAMAVAESPSRSYNPLFVYGGSGLGKTHLMHAIGQAVIQHSARKKVVYVSSEAFTNEFISLLRENRMEAFKNRYRSTDILLIDDIQFLANKKETQEEFFHTFNALHDAGKQIIISSDRHPQDINPLEERLRSRFKWGLICDIQPPDWETRCAILQQKALRESMELDAEVAYYIADKIKVNIRELEGALNKVIYYCQLNHMGRIDLSTAREALWGLLPEDEAPKLTISLVQKEVAEYFQISPDDMKSKKKDRYITHPRQVAMYLCRELIGATQPQIGRDFGNRDHTTVIHACEKIGKNRVTDMQLDRSINDLEKILLKK